MPERMVDRVIHRVPLSRSDHEALMAHCARRGVAIANLLEQILAEAAEGARRAAAGKRIEAAREKPAHSRIVPVEITESEMRRQEAADMRLLDLQARHGAAFMTPAGIPASPVPDRSLALTEPPVAVLPKPGPPASVLEAVLPTKPLLPALRPAIREPGEKRPYVRLSSRKDEIRALVELGYADMEIARHYGASYANVGNVRRSLGLEKNAHVKRGPAGPLLPE